MPAVPRHKIFDRDNVGVYHCFNKIVFDMYLLGQDHRWEQICHHRKEWILKELRRMAAGMAFEVLDFALLDNHFHLIVRFRPDILAGWSAMEVRRRWNIICPEVFDDKGNPTEPSERQLRLWAKETKLVDENRYRLGDLGWFMGLVQQRVARLANLEQGTTGSHFWAGRYKAKKIEDEASLLACSMYVNLNPLRAGITANIEDPAATSFYARIKAHAAASRQSLSASDGSDLASILKIGGATSEPGVDNGAQPFVPSALPPTDSDNWLAELFLDERAVAYTAVSPMVEPSGHGVAGSVAVNSISGSAEPQLETLPAARASNKGYLPVRLPEYAQLLMWAAARIRNASQPIPEAAQRLLDRVGTNVETWMSTILQTMAKLDRFLGQRHRPVPPAPTS